MSKRKYKAPDTNCAFCGKPLAFTATTGRKQRYCNFACKQLAYRNRKTYKLTREEYLALVEKQGGLCAICKKPSSKLVIDLSHKTGRVRGLLCKACNQGIGFLDDDTDRLAAAIEYLRAQEPETAHGEEAASLATDAVLLAVKEVKAAMRR
jgi:hypothetical protein